MECEKINMDNYRFYLPARVRNFESAEPDLSSLVYCSGASIGPGDGDYDGCTFYDGDSNNDATFFFQTCFGCEFDFGVAGLSFSTSPSSSLFGS